MIKLEQDSKKILWPYEKGSLPYWLMRILGDEYFFRYLTKEMYVLSAMPDEKLSEDQIKIAITKGQPANININAIMVLNEYPDVDKESIKARWPEFDVVSSKMNMVVICQLPNLYPVSDFFKIFFSAKNNKYIDLLIAAINSDSCIPDITEKLLNGMNLSYSWPLEKLDSFYLQTFTGVIWVARKKSWGEWPDEIEKLIDYG